MDPQIGRFLQIDPLSERYVYNSTYAYAENDVVNSIDLEGLERGPVRYMSRSNYADNRRLIGKLIVMYRMPGLIAPPVLTFQINLQVLRLLQ